MKITIQNNGVRSTVKLNGQKSLNVKPSTTRPIVRVTSKTGSGGGGGGGGTWGSITGTLSDQVDLQNALNLKLNVADFKPAGSNAQIQYNSGGSFAASPALTFDGTTVQLSSLGGGGNRFLAVDNTGKLTATLPYTPENVSNKAINFSVVNDTLYPTVNAVKAYADSLVIGLLDDRGNYDASSNLFPSTGGSGLAGAILKGDLWTISVGGTLGGQATTPGDVVRALTDAPGQTSANWAISENNIGYVPLSNVLANGKIFIGSAGNIATAQTMSGDVTISNAGITAIGTGKVLDTMLAVSYIKVDGTRQLTGNWNAGAFSGKFNNVEIGSANNTISWNGGTQLWTYNTSDRGTWLQRSNGGATGLFVADDVSEIYFGTLSFHSCFLDMANGGINMNVDNASGTTVNLQPGALVLIGNANPINLQTSNKVNISYMAGGGALFVQTDNTGNLVTHALSSGDVTTALGFTPISGNQTITLSGDVSGSGATAITTAIGAGKVTNTMLAGSIAYSKLSLTGSILNADLAGSIADGKLASSYIFADGTRALTADWNAGAFKGIFNSVIVGNVANQIAYGSGSGGNGTVTSTSNATKGKIFLGSAQLSYWDEANGQLFARNDALAVTQTLTNGVYLQNNTAAAAGAQQISPAITQESFGWGTTAGTSQSIKWQIYSLPIQGTVPTAQWLLRVSIAGGAFVTPFTINSNTPPLLWESTGLSIPSFGSPSTYQVQNRNGGNSGAGIYLFTWNSSQGQSWGSGTSGFHTYVLSYAPTSGTGVFNMINVAPTINQTGGASGITRTMFLTPTLTAAADHRILELGAGTATGLPLLFTSGTNLTTAKAGGMEYNGTNLFFTRTGTTRESVFVGVSGATAPTTVAAGTITNRYGNATNFLGDPNSWASVVINGTTFKIPLYT